MYAETLPNCCGILEIGDFPQNLSRYTPERIQENVEDTIVDACIDESKRKGKKATYNFFIATTNKEQMFMHSILKSLGFKSRKFMDRFGEHPLYFWSRRGLPKHLYKRYRTEKSTERGKNYDRW